MDSYDVVVIGSGPGGYVAAIRASQLGLKTAIIEKSELGGICLNWGCIPTKTLLDSAHFIEKLRFAGNYGIQLKNFEIDFSRIIERSRNVANQMSKGVEYLMRKNQIQVIYGFAIFRDTHTIAIFKDETLSELLSEIQTRKTIIAVGGRARELSNISFDGEMIIDYKKAMTLSEIPEQLLIIGAGAIGVEYADFFRSVGSEVTLIEVLPHILPNEDEEIAQILENSFKKRGIHVYTEAKIQKIQKQKKIIEVEFKDKANQIHKESYDKVLLSVGIVANTDKLNLDSVFVDLTKDRIKVNSHYQSSNPDIYAIGDCIPGPALAHVASHEGIRAAEAIYLSLKKEGKVSLGSDFHYEPLDYSWIPYCTYSNPEVASIGFTEKKAKEYGYKILVGRFPYQALGRARASGEKEGMVKIIIDKQYHKILGLHIIGKDATELISEGVIATKGELLAEDIARTFHAHPTISESIMEAAANALGEAINI